MFSKIVSRLKKTPLEADLDKRIPGHEQLENEIDAKIINGDCSKYLDKKFIKPENSILSNIALQAKSSGYVLIPDVLSPYLVEQFRLEFDKIIQSENTLPYKIDRHDGATCIRIQPRHSLPTEKYPLTTAFFNLDAFKQIAQFFYSTNREKVSFNYEIFVHETPQTNNPLSMKLHWDRAQTLKFWIYIDDVPVEAGPMQVAAGSGSTNSTKRLAMSEKNSKLIGGVDNVADGKNTDTTVLTAKAGSILIHDTDAWHGSTPVLAGHTRRIMRGHTRLKG